MMPAVLKTHHALTDTAGDYTARYGYLGAALHAGVVKLHTSTTTSTTAASQSPAVIGRTAAATAHLPFLQVIACLQCTIH